jgi:hypothetical protein
MLMQSNSKKISSYLPSLLLAGFGTVPNWFRCRGVIGPVPQPLWIRNTIQLKIKNLFLKRRGQIEKISEPLLIYQVALAGFGTELDIPLPRCHRASPSTSLDKKYFYFIHLLNLLINLL